MQHRAGLLLTYAALTGCCRLLARSMETQYETVKKVKDGVEQEVKVWTAVAACAALCCTVVTGARTLMHHAACS